MSRVARARVRTASPDELAEDRRRCLAAKPRQFATVEAFEAACQASQPPRETMCAGPKRTQNAPAVTMTDLVEGGR